MTMQELEKKCIDEAIKNVGYATETGADYFKGRASTFFYIVSLIQNSRKEDQDK
jgi:hypothetical protein